MNLVKFEILWTRKCPLKCSYCAMVNPFIERAPVEKMKYGLTKLKSLGCGFAAIYGASPLYDFTGLPEYIKFAESIGILTTVIVDGVDVHSRERLFELYENGLRSATFSYDFKPYDEWSRKKSLAALDLIKMWSGLPDIRDVEIVSTVTLENYYAIMVGLEEFLSEDKTWFSFDFLHIDRGNLGSKCKGTDTSLLMQEDQIKVFTEFLLTKKLAGFKIHQSEKFLTDVLNEPSMVVNHSWKCAPDKVFPSWLTIDADGSVLPCDDFYTSRDLKVWDLNENTLKEFTKFYSKEIKNKCHGCSWSTHMMAHEIKSGGDTFDNYVHR